MIRTIETTAKRMSVHELIQEVAALKAEAKQLRVLLLTREIDDTIRRANNRVPFDYKREEEW